MYKLFYWPQLPGRGEFIRLILEEIGADYIDVGRLPSSEGGGIGAIVAARKGGLPGTPAWAPPILQHGELAIAQVANIAQYLARRHSLVGADPAVQASANMLAMTLMDLVAEAHDVHHRLATSLAYEDQREVCIRGAERFHADRLPALLAYLEQVLEHADSGGCLAEFSYVDLMAFQLVKGLDFAFPRAMDRLSGELPRLRALHEAIAARPRIRAYLDSERALGFTNDGIFRAYPELDIR